MLAALLLGCALLAQQPHVEGGVPSTGRADPRLTSFDALMRDFVRERGAPGATLAVSRDGRLVYARGFGFADPASGEVMPPEARMRIASLSKPITAAMVLLLAQEGALELDDPALALLDPRLYRGRVPADGRWGEVTVAHLLEHTAGLDRRRSGDAPFMALRIARELGIEPPASAGEVVAWRLQRPLDHDPGTRFEYSNLGYSLLGRVIERVTGLGYEEAVRTRLLEPLGAGGMRIGGSLREERLPGEVAYASGRRLPGAARGAVGELVEEAYGGWDQRGLDAHGGWVASAPELLRFARLFRAEDGPGLLGAASRERAFAEPATLPPDPERELWYAAGWSVRRLPGGRVHAWHLGALPGTSALLVLRADGLAWCALFNGLADREGRMLAEALDPLLHRAAAEVQAWPDFDLFEAATGSGEAPSGESGESGESGDGSGGPPPAAPPR